MPKLKPTSFDYLVMALNPALVIALVGSLVFFLIEVFYEGEFQLRLCFIMGCFSMGTVGITRIAIEFDAARASLYGLALSAAMLFVAPRFAQINILLLILLLAVIWYSAHRLTWDCTLIDEEQDASGEGLLQHIGLDEAPLERSESALPKQPLWKKLFAPDKSKHAPGLTVVYFSLAALPIFGILQGFIPTSDVEARGRAFLSLIAYMGAGLGLLLTTSLLGLRRYLRQRQVEMPADMTATWLAVGGGLIAIVLVIASILPRSTREFQLGKTPITFTSTDLTARRGGWGNEGAKGDQQGKAQNPNEQNPNGQQGDSKENNQQGQPQGEAKNGNQGQGDSKSADQKQGQNGDPQSGKSNDPSNRSGDQKQGESKPSESQNDPNRDQEGNQGSKQNQNQGNDSKEGKQGQRQEEREPNQRNGNQAENRQSGENQKEGEQSREQQDGRQNDPARNQGQRNGASAAQQRPQPAQPNFKMSFDPTATIPFLGWLLKVLIVAAIVVVLLYCAIRYRKEFLAAIRQLLTELANFWRSLFWGKHVEGVAMDAAPVVQHRRFSEIANPFRRGGAGQSPRELVQTTFIAMEAWARDHGYPRDKDETAFEFAESLSLRVTDLAKESKWLADCYSRAAYSSEEVSTQVQSSLAAIWQRMEQLHGRIPPPAPIPPPMPGSV
jgi:hypothetical protein